MWASSVRRATQEKQRQMDASQEYRPGMKGRTPPNPWRGVNEQRQYGTSSTSSTAQIHHVNIQMGWKGVGEVRAEVHA